VVIRRNGAEGKLGYIPEHEPADDVGVDCSRSERRKPAGTYAGRSSHDDEDHAARVAFLDACEGACAYPDACNVAPCVGV